MTTLTTKLVYVVGISDAEANSIVSIHRTYEGALKSWNKERIRLIKVYKQSKYISVVRGWSHDFDNGDNIEIENLSCEDPEKIDNYPQETPYISTYELLD